MFRTAVCVAQEVEAPVTGSLPPWLSGTLLRNGPAQFEVGKDAYRHWFDGLAQLHRFHISAGSVRYSSQPLHSESQRLNTEAQRIAVSEFGTHRSDDPCAGIFRRFFSNFSASAGEDNCNISIAPLGDAVVALQERRHGLRIDPDTLASRGQVKLGDGIAGQTTTAHPHYSADGRTVFNMTTSYGPKSSYCFYTQPNAAGGGEARVVASIPVSHPAYLHSFGLSEHYLVLAEWPLTTHPLRLATMNFGRRAYIENFSWKAEQPTRFHLVHRDTAAVIGPYTAPACFAFHHVNAYDETAADGARVVHVDLCCYDDSSIIQAFYLDNLRQQKLSIPLPNVRRYTLPVPADGKLAPSSAAIQPRVLSPHQLELPRINYARVSGRPYRFCYGLGRDEAVETGKLDGSGDAWLFSSIVKLGVQDGQTATWSELGCHPSEPLFVPSPSAAADAEDDGVVLCIVLQPGSQSSFLLVLDAASMKELARASVQSLLPVGLHGMYVHSGSSS